jgi:hypothetical protein
MGRAYHTAKNIGIALLEHAKPQQEARWTAEAAANVAAGVEQADSMKLSPIRTDGDDPKQKPPASLRAGDRRFCTRLG